MKLKIDDDPSVDAIYIHLSNEPYAFGKDLDHERRVDFAKDHSPVGVELLCVSRGAKLAGLPYAEDIAAALKQHKIRVLS